jgi:hypothetical protein
MAKILISSIGTGRWLENERCYSYQTAKYFELKDPTSIVTSPVIVSALKNFYKRIS